MGDDSDDDTAVVEPASAPISEAAGSNVVLDVGCNDDKSGSS